MEYGICNMEYEMELTFGFILAPSSVKFRLFLRIIFLLLITITTFLLAVNFFLAL